MKKIFLISFLLFISLTFVKAQKNKKGNKEESKTETSKTSAAKEEVSEIPQMKVQLGHTSYISNYAVSPDGKFLVTTAVSDNLCKLWDIATARELLTFKKDTAQINALHFSLDGNYLLSFSGSHERTLRVLEVLTGKEIGRADVHPGIIDEIQLIPNTQKLVYMNRDPNSYNTVFVSPLSNQRSAKPFTGNGNIKSYRISPDGKFLTTVTQNGLSLWDIESGKELQKITFTSYSEHKMIQLPTFTADSKFLYYETDKEIKKINLINNQIADLPGTITKKEITTITKDGRYLITSTWTEPNVFIYSLSDGKLFKEIPKENTVRDFSQISDDGSYLIQKADYRSSRTYDLKSGKTDFVTLNYNEITPIPGTNYLITKKDSIYEYSSMFLVDALSGRVLKEFKSYVKGVSFSRFSPDGKYAVWIQDSTRLVLWDLYAGAIFKNFQAHTDDIAALAFSHNGKWIATSSLDKTIKLWDIETGKLIRSMSVYTKWISSVVFSPDDAYLAAQAEELTFKVWSTETGKEFKKYKGHTERISCVAFTPDGKFVVSGAWDKTIKIWNISTSTLVRTITGFEHPVNSIAFSKDGKLIAAGGGDKKFGTFSYSGTNKIRIWEFATGKIITTLPGPFQGSIIQLYFTDDAKQLLSRTDVYDRIAGWEIVDLDSRFTQQMHLWNLADGKELRSFTGNFQDPAKLFPSSGLYLYPDEKNRIHLADIATGSDKKIFSGHVGTIQNITLSSDGNYMLSRSNEDGFVKMWNIKSQQEVLNYIVLGGKNNDYLIYSSDNYYMSSKGGAKAVHFIRNFKVYEFEQFDLQYNRPDKVLGRLSGISQELIDSYSKAYKKRLKKLDFTEEMFSTDLHLPVVKITSKTPPLTTKIKTLPITINISDSKYSLDRLYVSVNDVPVYGMKGIELKSKKTKQLDMPLTVNLTNGSNKIKISCVNDKGVESLAENIQIEYDGAAYKPTLYLITIGVSKYKDSKMDLQFASKDATDLAELFKQSNPNYASVQHFSFINDKATRENILAIKAKLMTGKADDVVMLMVSSHGLLDSELDYYIATHDVDFTNPAQRGLSYEALESILDGIPQRKKILFMDACHSGEVDKEEVQITKNTSTEDSGNLMFRSFPGTSIKKIGLENSFELMKEMFADLRRGSGATVISSAGGAEYAIEGTEWNNGVFTYCLINGLRNKKADLNQDGKIVLSEIEEYLQTKVPELTAGKQRPTSRAENLSNDFVIW
jgi:WD40 repeat protein